MLESAPYQANTLSAVLGPMPLNALKRTSNLWTPGVVVGGFCPTDGSYLEVKCGT